MHGEALGGLVSDYAQLIYKTVDKHGSALIRILSEYEKKERASTLSGAAGKGSESGSK